MILKFNKLRQNLLTISTIIVLLLPILALATTPVKTDQGLTGILNQTGSSAGWDTKKIDKTTGLSLLLGTIARSIMAFLGVMFIIYTIYGGWLWLTAAGNDEKIGKAKKIIRDGFIGLVVVLSTAGIYYLVSAALTGLTQAPTGDGTSSGG